MGSLLSQGPTGFQSPPPARPKRLRAFEGELESKGHRGREHSSAQCQEQNHIDAVNAARYRSDGWLGLDVVCGEMRLIMSLPRKGPSAKSIQSLSDDLVSSVLVICLRH